MLICMDADFFFLLLGNLCERGGGRKLKQIVFSHFHNIIGFKVTMTVLHVCAFAVVSGFIHVYIYVAANMVEQAEGNEN